MTLQEAQAYVNERISEHCEAIRGIFKQDQPRHVTVIVRPPGKPEQEVIVTADPDPQALIETIRRRFELPPAVDLTPWVQHTPECAELAVFPPCGCSHSRDAHMWGGACHADGCGCREYVADRSCSCGLDTVLQSHKETT